MLQLKFTVGQTPFKNKNLAALPDTARLQQARAYNEERTEKTPVLGI